MKESFSKLDVARSQLETAIQLHFKHEDPVSIHTLIRAAHEILEELCRQQGHNSRHIELIESVKPEYRSLVKRKLSEAKNFFKHAKTDPSATLKFDTELSDFYIWDASKLYQKLTNENPKELFIYDVWFAYNNPDLFGDEARKLFESMKTSIDSSDKARFYELSSKAYEKMQLPMT